MFKRDKVLHFLVGLFVYGSVYGVLRVVNLDDLWMCFGLPLVVAAFAGAMKELYDVWGSWGGTGDVWDFVATFLGGVVAGLVLLAVHFSYLGVCVGR